MVSVPYVPDPVRVTVTVAGLPAEMVYVFEVALSHPTAGFSDSAKEIEVVLVVDNVTLV